MPRALAGALWKEHLDEPDAGLNAPAAALGIRARVAGAEILRADEHPQAGAAGVDGSSEIEVSRADGAFTPAHPRACHHRGMRRLACVLALLVGCESGTEVAGVSAVVIGGTPDQVVVTATLGCMLAGGRHRADGNCDADDSKVCVEARWFTAATHAPPSAATPGAVAKREVCERVGKVRGATIELRFPALPPEARNVLVFSRDQDRLKDERERAGVVATR